MLLGMSKAIITPPLGMELAGYGQQRASESVLDELELRAFWFQEEATGQAACLITADLLGFSDTLTPAIRNELAERFGIRPEAILLAASHTHSGPQTCENAARAGGPPDPDYIRQLRGWLVEAVAEAREKTQPVTLHVGRGKLSGYAINRRVLVDGVAVMAPNPEGKRDDEVTVLTCREEATGSVRAVLFHYTCHPTVMGDLRITGDYPGAARRHVEQAFEGACAGFLPGCFGDVRPDCTVMGRKAFRRGIPEDVAAFGKALGEEIVRVVNETTEPLTPRLFARAESVVLPLAMEPEQRILSLQRLDLAAELTLVAMGGEICVDYGDFIKAQRPPGGAIPIGYANGMIGYIASARLFPEGGYEPDTSHEVFDLPSPFQPSIEPILQEAIRAILQG